MATSSSGAAGSNAGGGSSPGSSKPSFTAARDGKAQEPARPKTPTQQQQRAADKVVQLQQQNANKIEQTSAKAALSFNVRSEGLPQSKSTVKPKKQQQDSYKAKDGKTYTSQQAITAAQNLDKSKQAAKTSQTKTKIKKHHAPAPKPPGVARNANRGRSTAQTPTKEQQPQVENDNQKLTAKQQRILARSLERANQNSKTRERTKQQSKGMGR